MLHLLPFTPDHYSTLSGWFGSDADVVQWGGPYVHFPLSDEQMAGMLDEGRSDPPARLCWMAQDGDRLVGHVQIAFDWRNGNATLGRVAIAPDARGRGLAVPMLRLALASAFAFDAIERLELNVYAWNRPAIRSYEWLGFVTECIRLSSVRVGDARWDTAIMRMLRSEWTDGTPA